MKKIVCTALALMLLVSSAPAMGTMFPDASAVIDFELAVKAGTNGTYGSLTYYIEDSEAATIVKCDTSASGTVVIPETLEGVPVVTIGASAFLECTLVTNIVIPSSVTLINTGAFAGCSGLESIIIPNGVKNIGYYAFDGCTSLNSAAIPESVATIGEKPFRSCTKLQAITVASGNASYAAKDGVLYNKGVTSIVDYPVAKPDKTFTLPSTVTSIGNYAFYECEYLETLDIPNSVKSIGEQSIRGCKKLAAISIGTGVSSMGNAALASCESLTRITVASGNNVYSAKDGVLYNKNQTELYCCGGGVSGVFKIPNSVNTVIGLAMASCNLITEINVPASVTTIEANAFRDCNLLANITVASGNKQYSSSDGVLFDKGQKNLICFPGGRSGAYVIPSGTISIEKYAFYACDEITSVDFPASISTMGNYAFMACVSLKSAFFFGSAPNSFGASVFDSTAPSFAIYYTAQYKNDWAPDGRVVWNGYPIYELTKIGKDANGYEYLIADGEARITAYTGSGGAVTLPAMVDGYPVSVVYDGLYRDRADITGVSIENGINAIPNNMFNGCSKLSIVTVPSTVRSIGKGAFYGCGKLASVNIPNGVDEILEGTFYGCAGLTRVSIPRTVVVIGRNAFYGCDSIKTVAIPISVITIEAYAFYSCDSLERVSIGAGIKSIESMAFAECPKLVEAGFDAKPPEVFGTDVFKGADASFVVRCFEDYMKFFAPNGETTWKGYALAKRDLVENGFIYYVPDDINVTIKGYNGDSADITVPSTISGRPVRTIEEGAFENIDSIISIVIPDSVTAIGANAFAGCTSLVQAWIGSGVTTIGDMAFDGCGALLEITVKSENQAFSSLNGVLYDRNRTKLIVFPDAVDGAYIVPDGVTVIAPYAFADCVKLSSVKLPYGLTAIGKGAFRLCSSLNGIVLPSTVTSIDNGAFISCGNLDAACFKGEPPESFGTDVFTGASNSFTIRYLRAYASKWAPRGENTYKGYDIQAFDSYPELTLAENSTSEQSGAYLVGIPVKTIAVELIMMDIASNGVRLATSDGKSVGDYELVCTGYMVQLVQSGVVVDELSTVVMGDVNGDGHITSRDLAMLQRSITGISILSGAYFMAGDITDDSMINSRDLAILQRYILGGIAYL